MSENIKPPIFSALESKSIEWRKAKNPLGLFLNSIIGRAKDLSKAETKNGIQPPLTDDHVVRTIRTAIKEQDDVIQIIEGKEDHINEFVALNEKKTILQSFLPAQPSYDELHQSAKLFVTSQTSLTGNPKQVIGPAIKHLTDKYGASLDKAEASKAVQQAVKEFSEIKAPE